MGGDYWFTYVYKSQTAERLRAAEQEHLAAEAHSVYRQQQLAGRLRRHQVKLTASEQPSWHKSPAGLPPQPRSSSGSRRLELATYRRPDGGPVRLRAVDQSAELHIISFDSRERQDAFATDPSRLQLMRLLQGRLLRQRVFEVTESALNYGTADRFGGGLPKGKTR